MRLLLRNNQDRITIRHLSHLKEICRRQLRFQHRRSRPHQTLSLQMLVLIGHQHTVILYPELRSWAMVACQIGNT